VIVTAGDADAVGVGETTGSAPAARAQINITNSQYIFISIIIKTD